VNNLLFTATFLKESAFFLDFSCTTQTDGSCHTVDGARWLCFSPPARRLCVTDFSVC